MARGPFPCNSVKNIKRELGVRMDVPRAKGGEAVTDVGTVEVTPVDGERSPNTPRVLR